MSGEPASERLTTFVGGKAGSMVVLSQTTLSGPPIPQVARVHMVAGEPGELTAEAAWTFRGVTTNDRYTTRPEKNGLLSRQAPVGRPEATHAALILLRKKLEWWALAQDERRAILEEDSHHIAIGLRYLPAVARKLLHCRDLASDEPFDFLAFLDFAPADGPAFDDMLAELRSTVEWTFYDREIDIRLVRKRDLKR